MRTTPQHAHLASAAAWACRQCRNPTAPAADSECSVFERDGASQVDQGHVNTVPCAYPRASPAACATPGRRRALHSRTEIPPAAGRRRGARRGGLQTPAPAAAAAPGWAAARRTAPAAAARSSPAAGWTLRVGTDQHAKRQGAFRGETQLSKGGATTFSGKSFARHENIMTMKR